MNLEWQSIGNIGLSLLERQKGDQIIHSNSKLNH